MDIKDVAKLIKLVEDSGLSKLSVEESGVKIELVKETPQVMQTAYLPTQKVNSSNNFIEEPIEKKIVEKISEVKDDSELFLSPMVGTFYLTASPDSPPFVKKGEKISKGQTVCIIEAMKLFNEIESEYDGIIVDILVKPEEAVEFGQPLFKIKKNV
jgi:acetyl-CoA carboxylase biotin carboxyl carrier protein